MNHFHMPSTEAFDKLVRDQRLEAPQARELHSLLLHLDQDLIEHRKRLEGRQPRRELVRRLRRVAKCVDDLEFELNRWRNTLGDFLPLDTQEEIGQLLSFTAMEAALGTKIQLRELSSTIEKLKSEDPDFRMAQLEERLLARRQARGLEHGGALLLHFIERINRPIRTWFELDRLNPGGRPRVDLARDLLLIRLVDHAPAIIGRRATATARGVLCNFAPQCLPRAVWTTRESSAPWREGSTSSDRGVKQAQEAEKIVSESEI